MTITHEELARLLHYDPETGLFTRTKAVPNRNIKEGDVAGCVATDGYVVIQIKGKIYKAHRLAWLYTHGSFPNRQLDHKDRDRSNNRLDNLRLSTPKENQSNKGMLSSNTTGFKGVSLSNNKTRYKASISIDGRMKHLGIFNTKEEAAIAYDSKAIELHGEYAVTNRSLGLL